MQRKTACKPVYINCCVEHAARFVLPNPSPPQSTRKLKLKLNSNSCPQAFERERSMLKASVMDLDAQLFAARQELAAAAGSGEEVESLKVRRHHLSVYRHV